MMHGSSPNRKEQFLERPLPSSDGSERCILGAVLIDNALMSQAVEKLRAEDFYSPLNRRIFRAMLNLYAASSKIDPILIGEELKKDGSVESIGGVAAIANLTYGIPFFTDIAEYVEIVHKKSHLRQLIRTCNEIVSEALSEDDDADSVFSNAQEQINSVCLAAEASDGDEHFVQLGRVLDSDVFARLENLRTGVSNKIKTGFAAIDDAIGGGVALSDVVLVAADTGHGKSAIVLQTGFQMAHAGYPTAFLAGEMTNGENVMRLLSQLSGITNLNWKTHITENELQMLNQWAKAIKDVPLYFEHRISDMHSLRTYLHTIVPRKKIKVLVIDYIQLFKMEKLDKRKRNERIAECSQEVKRLANELNIAIIEVAQFNREGAKSVQAGLHDLEGSGQLEKDASLIFILEISDNEFPDIDGRKYRDAKIRIVKGRNVGKGEVHGRYYGRSVQFQF